MKNQKLMITFFKPITGNDLGNIISLFHNNFSKKDIGYLINKMEDVYYKNIQLTVSLTKEEELFFIGLLIGYIRTKAIFNHIDQYGGITNGY